MQKRPIILRSLLIVATPYMDELSRNKEQSRVKFYAPCLSAYTAFVSESCHGTFWAVTWRWAVTHMCCGLILIYTWVVELVTHERWHDSNCQDLWAISQLMCHFFSMPIWEVMSQKTVSHTICDITCAMTHLETCVSWLIQKHYVPWLTRKCVPWLLQTHIWFCSAR